MHIKKSFYDPIISDLSVKARDDSFTPKTVTSKNFKTWTAVLDIKICLACAEKHGRIFDLRDKTFHLPPLHMRYRCTLKMKNVTEAGNATDKGEDGADYWLKHYGHLPSYYISSPQLESLGWKYGDRPSKFAPGKMLGGDVYYNDDRKMPHRIGRVWYEADINYTQGRRNRHRIFWSNDGLIFVSYDHGDAFYEII